MIDRTIAQVRSLALDLRPSMLDDLGLVDALRSYSAGFARRSGVDVRFAAEEIGRLDTDVETACYRIAQEALTNVARHAEARRVAVELSRLDDAIELLVVDDGRGFDVPTALTSAAGGRSLGLLNMRERASLVGGWLEVISRPGEGCELRATLPLENGRSIAAGGAP
jgi:signal transduction histidine kinase